MSTVYPCAYCGTQNFATPARFRKAGVVPLRCWKCGKEIKKTSTSVKPGRRGEAKRKAKDMKPKG